jgi:transposase, IS5 family
VVSRNEVDVGIDRRTKLICAAVVTPANVAHNTVLPALLYGQETRVWGDQAYCGRKVIIRQNPESQKLYQSPLPPSRCGGRDRAGEEPYQIKGARSGRASDQGYQTGVRLRQGDATMDWGRTPFVTCALANLFMTRRNLLRRQQV